MLGGFGGLGNPSSFHNDTVRALRRTLFDLYRPVLREYALLRGLGEDARAEMLFDRIGMRHRSFGAVTKETWHRDTYDGARHGLRDLPRTLSLCAGSEPDVIFGGWVNLGERPQFFDGVLGSQDEAAAAGGFGPRGARCARRKSSTRCRT